MTRRKKIKKGETRTGINFNIYSKIDMSYGLCFFLLGESGKADDRERRIDGRWKLIRQVCKPTNLEDTYLHLYFTVAVIQTGEL